MDRHPNFPEDGESPWYQADDRYERGGWNSSPGSAPRGRAEDRYRVPEPRGHGGERADQDRRGAGRDGQAVPDPYDAGDDSGRFRATHSGGARPDAATQHVDAYGAARPEPRAGSYPDPGATAYPADGLGGQRADPLGGVHGDPTGGPHGDPLSGAQGDPMGGAHGDPGGRRSDGDPARFHTQPLDRAALRRPDLGGDRPDAVSGAPGTAGAGYGQPGPGGPASPAGSGVGAPGGPGAAGGGPGVPGAGGPGVPGLGVPGAGVPGAGRPGPDRPGKVYRTGRPTSAVLIIAVLAVCELIAFRVFAAGMFGGPLETSGTVSGMLLLVGFPLTGFGAYTLATGGAAANAGPQAWLRLPLAYLWIGLVLLLAAGAAA